MSLNTNNLAEENSPYLLQHAQNPVHWQPWNQKVLNAAAKKGNLLIISIGYSSCHWCHVMEHESFEDTSVANIMNEHFTSIKVDREEQPDVDEVYMTAAQLMTGRGGWPLNVVALPDGRPVWAGTYVPKDQWKNLLTQLHEMYQKDSSKFEEYATQLTEGIVKSQLIELVDEQEFTREDAKLIFNNWKDNLDFEEGGAKRAPKFPLPGAQGFLLHFGHLYQNDSALEHVKLTLEKMAHGGIYDQVGGGFARYSTDALWKVPHFEKMLYDNAQLISLYSKAYQKFKKPLYREVVEESLKFIDREMTHQSGAFYSALDADSEGEEGKFYVWTQDELRALIPADDWPLFSDYYNINEKGYWEHGNYILLRDTADEFYQKAYSLSKSELEKKRANWQNILLTARNKRVRPGLDDKALTSWNALMITAYLDAYMAFGNAEYLAVAKKNARWILEKQSVNDKELRHSYRNGESYLQGLLEDYAFSAQAFIKLFEVTGNISYLKQAERWVEHVQQNFQDNKSGFFFTRSLKAKQLIAKSLETADNVIPSANSTMAHNLFRLSHYTGKTAYDKQARKMLSHVKSRTLNYGESYFNWADLMLHLTEPFYEIAISGSDAQEKHRGFMDLYLPQVLLIHSTSASDVPLLKGRYVEGKTLIYVCEKGACKRPVVDVKDALELITQL